MKTFSDKQLGVFISGNCCSSCDWNERPVRQFTRVPPMPPRSVCPQCGENTQRMIGQWEYRECTVKRWWWFDHSFTEYTNFIRRSNCPGGMELVREALTPSGFTKSAYWGSDELPVMDWNNIKTIMRLIRERSGVERHD
jgi:hypothetical protein